MAVSVRAIRVTHVINGLERGGAETVLARLVAKLDPQVVENRVISLTGHGPIGNELGDAGVPVSALEFPRNLSGVARYGRQYGRLVKVIRDGAPDIVQTWMYHSDLIGGSAARLAGCPAVIWNLRQSHFDPDQTKKLTLMAVRTAARLSSHIPWAIVCGSYAARDVHSRLGYDLDKMLVIANGFDAERFRPSAEGRRAFRERLGESARALLIGLPARYHPQKDHGTFLRAAAEAAKSVPSLRFVMFGDRVDDSNEDLLRLVSENGLSDRLRMIGQLSDPRDAFCALDIVVSSSAFGEGAPNVIGEAMSCAVPCVATDVGDCRRMIDSTGIVVPPNQPQALAQAIIRLAEMDDGQRREKGRNARRRIQTEFPIHMMVRRYELLYRRVFSQRFPRTQPASLR